MRRIAAAFLPCLRIELAVRQGEPAGPLALVVAKPGGAVKDERSLLGNTRLDEVCPEAYARGLRPRQTLAAARARCTELRVRVVSEGDVTEVLGGVAEVLLSFGATTSFDLARSCVWVDVTGCAHLHRSEEDPSGEPTLARRIQGATESRGHACRVVIANGPEVAAAVAQCGSPSTEPVLVPPGGAKRAMQELPLAALPLPEDVLHWLFRLGMRSVGDLQALPRRSLGARLGSSGPRLMALLDGEDRTPLTPYVPPFVPEETASLEYAIESTDALLFIAKTLADRMAARLAGRAMAAAGLELVVELDRAFALETPRAVLPLPLASPLAESADLLNVLRAKVESFAIEAPIMKVVLRAPKLVPRTATPLHLFVPEARAERTLPRLVAELEAELGPGKVGVLSLADRWLVPDRSRLVPIGPAVRPPLSLRMPCPDAPRGALLSGAPEPTRVLDAAISVEGASRGLRDLRVDVRQEFAEWWTDKPRFARDYATAWIDSVQAVAWVELDRALDVALIRGWMD